MINLGSVIPADIKQDLDDTKESMVELVASLHRVEKLMVAQNKFLERLIKTQPGWLG